MYIGHKCSFKKKMKTAGRLDSTEKGHFCQIFTYLKNINVLIILTF